MKDFCWGATIVATILAVPVLVFGVILANGAPQQAAAAAIAAAMVIIPYVFSRAIEALSVRAPPALGGVTGSEDAREKRRPGA